MSTDPFPFRFPAARSKSIKNREPEHHQDSEDRPPRQAKGEARAISDREEGKHNGDDGESDHGDTRNDERADGQEQRHDLLVDEPPLLFFLIGDIEPSHERGHAGPRAPKCDQHAEDQSQAELACGLVNETAQGVDQQLGGFGRQESR
jgi:hypothetical protein